MNLMQIYSVPFWQTDYPDFYENRDKFLEVLKEYKDKNPSVKKSNIAGYHSPDNLQGVEELYPLYEYICDFVFKACNDLNFDEVDVAVTSSWFNVNDSRQCMNIEHVHGDTFSGVFYLKVPPGSGKLVVHNPSINKVWDIHDVIKEKNEFTAESITIEPVEGHILLFPSYLSHSVTTNDHDDERISISFNIIVLPKGTISKG